MIPSRRRVFARPVPADAALPVRTPLPWDDDPASRLAALETRHGGRLGVAMLDTGSGEGLAFRAFDRFARGRGFNPLLAARMDAGDTATPAAIVAALRRLLPDDALAAAALPSRHAMTAAGSGEHGLRAGLPGWRIGPMTGAGDDAACHDLVIAWPPGGGAPLLVVASWCDADATPARADEVLAEVGAIAAAWAQGG